MRFRRKSEADTTQLCCPQCKELLPEGQLDCDMCGFTASSEAEKAQCATGEGVVEHRAVSASEVPSRR
jgi:hypothetical protein